MTYFLIIFLRTSQEVGSGRSLEKMANSKILKTTGGLLGLTMAGYGLYKMFSKKDEDDN